MIQAEGYHLEELRACVLAREFRDGERGFLGANMGVGRAALLLAHRLHAPNLRMLLGFSWANVASEGELKLHADSTDHRDTRWGEGWMHLDTMINSYRFFSDVFVIGALQVDRFGNSNLIGLGADHRALRFRGPGAMGSVSSTAFCNRFYLTPSRHTREVFVEKCDFVSALGWGAGGPDGRTRLGLPGGGPQLCVTPRCVFDFDDATKALRLRSVHAGHTAEEVLENTGCQVLVPDHVGETAGPTDEELATLREIVDPEGRLRESVRLV